jgi:hypothetical protein
MGGGGGAGEGKKTTAPRSMGQAPTPLHGWGEVKNEKEAGF